MEERAKLEQEIAETTRSLQKNLAMLEDKTVKTVEGVTEGVKNTAARIQNGVKELSLSHQMEERPKAVMATALGVGLLAGLRIFRRPRIAGALVPSVGRTVVSAALSQATQTLVPIALGFAVEWATDKLSQRKKSRVANP